MSTRFAKKGKSTRQRKAGRPVFGCFLILIFGAFSWVIAPQVRRLIEVNTILEFPPEWPSWAPPAIVAVLIFAILFSVAMMLVALLAGTPKDPLDVRIPDSAYKKRRR